MSEITCLCNEMISSTQINWLMNTQWELDITQSVSNLIYYIQLVMGWDLGWDLMIQWEWDVVT